ncbi:MAG: serine hydrolase [Solirubrobacterales bacterium]
MRSYLIGNRALIGLLAAVIAVIAVAAVAALSTGSPSEPAAATGPPSRGPAAAAATAAAPARERPRASPRRRHRAAVRRRERVARAGEYAEGRDGHVAFAVAGPGEEIHGRNEHELFQSASAVKALILAAELQRVADAGGRLDPAAAAELRRMITVSDNDAASAVFARVGPEGVEAIAHRAGMRDFRASDVWGASAISAADMAAMFGRLGRVFPERYEKFGLGLLGSIVSEQAWGIPEVAGERGWSVRFKGGWRPDPGGFVVNQAAELRRGGERRAIAVLTDAQPSMAYGIETIEGITGRVLRGR